MLEFEIQVNEDKGETEIDAGDNRDHIENVIERLVLINLFSLGEV